MVIQGNQTPRMRVLTKETAEVLLQLSNADLSKHDTEGLQVWRTKHLELKEIYGQGESLCQSNEQEL